MENTELQQGNILFLIPARGGSKGLPGKNLAPVGGIPLVGWAARTAAAAARTLPGSRVVCSTDDAAIAAAAREWGAETPFVRPAELATDGARTLDVVLHAVAALGGEYDAVVIVQPTSPLTEPEDLLGALALYLETGAPVISVCAADHPLEWYCRMDADGRLSQVFLGMPAHQRQMTTTAYRPNGCAYVASPDQLRANGFWTPQTRGFLMPTSRSIDVDCAKDLEVARALVFSRPIASVDIAGHKVGPGHPCFVIAEAGVNHCGSLEMALKLVEAAAEAGADAVKFQTFKAHRVAALDAPKAEYQAVSTGRGETQREMLAKLELSEEHHRLLRKRCLELGIIFLSTPFDEESADFLECLGVPAFKVGSGDLTNLPLLMHLAAKELPIILSTGMSTLREVAVSVDATFESCGGRLILLHCVSCYPADVSEANLSAMAEMREAFQCPVGFSDHTVSTLTTVAAVALGASVVEKHFTMDRSLPGPDHQASVDPFGLKEWIQAIRMAEAAVGRGSKRPTSAERVMAGLARRGIVAARHIAAGAVVNREDLVLLRPGTGIPAADLPLVVGKRTARDLIAGERLSWSDILVDPEP